MKRKRLLLKILIGGLALSFGLSNMAFGAANLYFSVVGPDNSAISYSTISSSNLLEAFWTSLSGVDPRSNTGLMLVADDQTQFNTKVPGANDTPSIAAGNYYAYKIAQSSKYFFWRYNSASAQGDPVYLRLWAGSKGEGGYYTVSSIPNGWAASSGDFTLSVGANGWYRAAPPYTPEILRFEEVSTTPVSGTATRSLKVVSTVGTGNDSNREINSVSWRWGTDPGNLQAIAGTDYTLTVQQDQLLSNTTYYFEVTNTNWFSSSSSTVRSYTIGGGVAAEAALEYGFTAEATGINTFSIPFDTTKVIRDKTGTPITFSTIGDLIKAINVQGTNNPVKVFGWWDRDGQKHVGLTSITPKADGSVTAANCTATGSDEAGILAYPIQQYWPYQVSVNSPMTFKISGYK
jgi:hypothetical protein